MLSCFSFSTSASFFSLRPSKARPIPISAVPPGSSAIVSRATSPSLNPSPDTCWAVASPSPPNAGCIAKASKPKATRSGVFVGTLGPISVTVVPVGVVVLDTSTAFSADFLAFLNEAVSLPAKPIDRPSITPIGIPRLRANSVNSAIFSSLPKTAATALSSLAFVPCSCR